MDLSILIVNWNTCDLLAQCLESIYAYPPIGDFQIVLVDNASADDSVTMVRERFPQVILIENVENVGFARANNQAIRLAQASGGHILFLNSDTLMRPGAVDQLMRVLTDNHRAGAVGPRVLNPDGTAQSSYGSLPSIVEEIVGPYLRDELIRPWGRIGRYVPRRLDPGSHLVQRVSFACTLVRDKALHQVGYLDESYEFYSEDYDFFKRLNDARWQVLYCPEATVVHYWGASSRKRSDWAVRQLYRSKRIYFEKHHGARARRVLDVGLGLRFRAKLAIGAALWSLGRTETREQIHMQQLLLADLRQVPWKTKK